MIHHRYMSSSRELVPISRQVDAQKKIVRIDDISSGGWQEKAGLTNRLPPLPSCSYIPDIYPGVDPRECPPRAVRWTAGGQCLHLNTPSASPIMYKPSQLPIVLHSHAPESYKR